MGHSIGEVVATPRIAGSARLRATLPGRFGPERIAELAADLARWAGELDDEHGPSRLTVRALIAADAIASIGALPGLEALAPLESGDAIAWFGATTPRRTPGARESARLDEVARRAAENHGPGPGPNLDKVRARLRAARAHGYAIAVAADADERAALADAHGKEIAALLERFGYDFPTTLAVLAEPTSLVATASFDGTAIAVVVLERLALPHDGDSSPVVLAELTDSSVDDAHVGSGLQLVLHTHLLRELVGRDEIPDLVFSESGYTASLFNAATLGRIFRGRLPNHAQIGTVGAADSREPAFQSLEVTTLGPTEVRALVAELGIAESD